MAAVGDSMLESIPPDVMTRVLEFVSNNISSRVKAASCSKTLQRIINEDCPALWSNIRFVPEGSAHVACITDTMLESLLTRVNAVRVTKRLNLYSCNSVTGTGLGPLRHSQVLEEVDLRHTCEGIEDERIAVEILRTMIPFKLSRVILQETIPNLSPVELNFLRDLRTARMKQHQDKSVMCHSCGECTVVSARQLVPSVIGPRSMCCEECNHSFCRRGSCSVGMVDCMKCTKAFCNDCEETEQCNDCKHTYCYECYVCNMCDTCGESYCKDCTDVPFCSRCCWQICFDCQEEAQFLFKCHDCGDVVCRNCSVRKLCECGRLLCGDYCSNDCPKCLQSFCDDCSDAKLNWLECCEDMRCTDCVRPETCDECSEKFCSVEVNKCSSCLQSFCESCRDMEHCVDCKKRFCMDDCNKGESAFRCSVCEKVSCKDCRDENGGACCSCDEKSRKKAKRI